MKYGITGHRDLTAQTVELVTAELRRFLPDRDKDLLAITSLAEGADQLFARLVLERGGRLDVIVPSLPYPGLREDRKEYHRLVHCAHRVTQLPYPEDGPAAHMAASMIMVERCDHLVAVWDGKPARSFAGTADVVAYARQLEVPITIIWPPGATRAT
ncbi:MAG TPA: hypothetical protein VFD49_24530 [Candidatus Dormibacteraeota bacterium]|nr:hypothetical protein [Candidatus Dormibacteraeota bacterium]